jgi:hypothetical protein
MYTKKGARLKFYNSLIVIIVCLTAAVTTAEEIRLEATFGGGMLSEEGEFIGPGFKSGYHGNTYSTSAQLLWSPVVFGLKPFGGVDYLWASASDFMAANTTGVSLGLGYSFKLGRAKSTISGGICRYFNKFSGKLKSGESVSKSWESTGAIFGCNLAFPFFKGLDSLLGYKVHLKDQFSYEGQSHYGDTYTFTGGGVIHVMYGGICIWL